MARDRCPTVVFFWGETAQAIGERIATLLAEAGSACPSSLWKVGHSDSGFDALQIVSGKERPAAGSVDRVAHKTLGGLVAAVVERALRVGDGRMATAIEHFVGLRLVLLVAGLEIDAPDFETLAQGLRAAGRRHLGMRHVTEACVLLPELLESQAEEARNAFPKLVNVVAPGGSSPPGPNRYDVYWWLGRVNAAGLTLPPLPHSTDEIATVVSGLLSVSPEHLPLTALGAAEGSIHMTAGYAELFFPGEDLARYLSVRHCARLVREAFLIPAPVVDALGMRRKAWEFSQSPDCAGAIEEVERRTPGGAGIRTGFNHTVPEEVSKGQIGDFLGQLHGAWDRFEDEELLGLRKQYEESGGDNRRRVQKQLESEVGKIADQAPGGLYAARAFLQTS